MDKAAKTALARRVGHMGYEQVRALFDEANKQLSERHENGCPDCRYNDFPQWKHCEEYKALFEGAGKHLLWRERSAHEKTCQTCYIENYYRELESRCEKCEERYDLFHLYAHRLSHLETKALERRFHEAHGRKHASVLELVEWDDAQRAAEVARGDGATAQAVGAGGDD